MSLICVTDLAFILVWIPHLINLFPTFTTRSLLGPPVPDLLLGPSAAHVLGTLLSRRRLAHHPPCHPWHRRLPSVSRSTPSHLVDVYKLLPPPPFPSGLNMTMTLDTSQQQRFGPPLSFDYAAHAQPPAFSNPWSSSSPQSTAGSANHLFIHSQPQHGLSHHHNLMAAKSPVRGSTSSASSMASYGPMALPATSSGKKPAGPRTPRLDDLSAAQQRS